MDNTNKIYNVDIENFGTLDVTDSSYKQNAIFTMWCDNKDMLPIIFDNIDNKREFTANLNFSTSMNKSISYIKGLYLKGVN